MSVLEHPKLLQMRALGLCNEEQLQAALLVYLNLTEVKLWEDVAVLPCTALDAAYFRGRRNKDIDSSDGAMCVVLPLPAHTQLSMESLSDYLSSLQEEACSSSSSGGGLGGGEQRSTAVTLALVESDSTIVYYKVSREPPQPTPTTATTMATTATS